jgi:hypothetical protein
LPDKHPPTCTSSLRREGPSDLIAPADSDQYGFNRNHTGKPLAKAAEGVSLRGCLGAMCVAAR